MMPGLLVQLCNYVMNLSLYLVFRFSFASTVNSSIVVEAWSFLVIHSYAGGSANLMCQSNLHLRWTFIIYDNF